MLTTPSSPCSRVASCRTSPSSYVGGTCTQAPCSSSRSSVARRSRERATGEVDAVQPQQVEDHEGDRRVAASAAARRGSCTCIRSASAPNDGTPPSRATTSPSRSMSANSAPSPASSGKLAVTSFSLREDRRQPPLAHVREHPHAVPLDLVRPFRRRGGPRFPDSQHGAHGSILTAGSALDDVSRRNQTCACHLEGCRVVRAGQRAGAALQRDREPRRAVPAGAPRRTAAGSSTSGCAASTASRSPTTTSPRATRPRTARWSSSPTRTSPSCP